MQNVLTAIFNVESEGYQAFKDIQNELASRQYLIPQMALVKKNYGFLQTLDSYESPVLTDASAFSGGLLGSLIGILGGPIGMLLGGAYGAAVGSVGDFVASDTTTTLLETVSEKLTDGTVAIVALVSEDDEAPLNAVLSKFDTVVLRRDIVFVAKEVVEAKRLELEIQNQVREQWKADKKKELQAKGQEFQASVQQKINQAKADFEAFRAKLKK